MKKNNIGKRICALSLAGAMALAHPETAKANQNTRKEITYAYIPTVTAIQNAFLMDRADASSNIVGVLAVNQSLPLFEETNNWYKVLYNNRYVYVYKYWVVQTNQVSMASPALMKVKLTSAASLCRDEALTSYICTIPANTTVEVYLNNPYTYFVKYNGQVGYINKTYTLNNNYDYNHNYNYNYNYVTPPTYNYQAPAYNQYNYYAPVENYYFNYNSSSSSYAPSYYDYNYYDTNKMLIRK